MPKLGLGAHSAQNHMSTTRTRDTVHPWDVITPKTVSVDQNRAI